MGDVWICGRGLVDKDLWTRFSILQEVCRRGLLDKILWMSFMGKFRHTLDEVLWTRFYENQK